MRTYALWNAWLSASGAFLSFLLLAFKSDWPLVLKYKQWEYAMKFISVSLWAAWGFWVIYGVTK